MKKLLLPLLLTLPVLAHAEDREWVPYKKVIDAIKLDQFYALPAAERDKVKVSARFQPKNKALPLSSVKLTLVHAEGRLALPLDSEGRINLPFNPKWIAEDAKIWTSLPKDEKAGIGFEVAAVLPDALQWNYATVMGSVTQTNALIDKLAGMMRIFAPTMKLVNLKFNKQAQLTIQSKGGEKRYATDAKNQITLKLDPALLAENPLVTVTERPFEAEVDGD
jgi:hypothetical protein